MSGLDASPTGGPRPPFAWRSPARAWRAGLAEQWTTVVAGRADRDSAPTATSPTLWARRAITVSELALRELVARQRPGGPLERDGCLRASATALEAAATVWHHAAPVAGYRHVHLVGRLERQLAAHEQAARAAEATLVVDRRAIAVAGKAARQALERLHNGIGDRADALRGLEDATVLLAALGVTACLNVDALGHAHGRREATAHTATALGQALAGVDAYSRRLLAGTPRAGTGAWFRQALVARPPVAAGERVDPGRAWRRLAACELILARRVSAELTPLESRAGLDARLVDRASRRLAAAGLQCKPADFDHARAWRHQGDRIARAVGAYARARQGGATALAEASELLAASLARALIALWALDAPLDLAGAPAAG